MSDKKVQWQCEVGGKDSTDLLISMLGDTITIDVRAKDDPDDYGYSVQVDADTFIKAVKTIEGLRELWKQQL